MPIHVGLFRGGRSLSVLFAEQEAGVGYVGAGEATGSVAGVVKGLAGPTQDAAAAVAGDGVAVRVACGGSDDAVCPSRTVKSFMVLSPRPSQRRSTRTYGRASPVVECG